MIESILDSTKVEDLQMGQDEFIQIGLGAQSEYVATLVRSLRETLTNHTRYLETYFKKNLIKVNLLNNVEQDFSLWLEIVYQAIAPFVSPEYMHECFMYGSGQDDLIMEYDTPTMRDKEIPKDALIDYVNRMREYLKVYPLKASILTKLKVTPQVVLLSDEEEQNVDAFEEIHETFSEGFVMVSGEKVPLNYPFYSIAKYLEGMKAFSEEKAINQKTIHEDLKLKFQSTRLKQWQKIKGKTNPVIDKVFNMNNRGMVWLKKNVKPV